MADPTAASAQAQDKFIVARVLKFLVPISSQPIINGFFHKHGKSHNVNPSRQAKDAIVNRRFQTAEELLPRSIHVNHIAKQAVPFRVLTKGFADRMKGPWAVAVISVENGHNVAGGLFNALVHGM